MIIICFWVLRGHYLLGLYEILGIALKGATQPYAPYACRASSPMPER